MQQPQILPACICIRCSVLPVTARVVPTCAACKSPCLGSTAGWVIKLLKYANSPDRWPTPNRWSGHATCLVPPPTCARCFAAWSETCFCLRIVNRRCEEDARKMWGRCEEDVRNSERFEEEIWGRCEKDVRKISALRSACCWSVEIFLTELLVFQSIHQGSFVVQFMVQLHHFRVQTARAFCRGLCPQCDGVQFGP